jgi:hypothetical protein
VDELTAEVATLRERVRDYDRVVADCEGLRDRLAREMSQMAELISLANGRAVTAGERLAGIREALANADELIAGLPVSLSTLATGTETLDDDDLEGRVNRLNHVVAALSHYAESESTRAMNLDYELRDSRLAHELIRSDVYASQVRPTAAAGPESAGANDFEVGGREAVALVLSGDLQHGDTALFYPTGSSSASGDPIYEMYAVGEPSDTTPRYLLSDESIHSLSSTVALRRPVIGEVVTLEKLPGTAYTNGTDYYAVTVSTPSA